MVKHAEPSSVQSQDVATQEGSELISSSAVENEAPPLLDVKIEELEEHATAKTAADASNDSDKAVENKDLEEACAAAELCQLHRASKIVESKFPPGQNSKDFCVLGPRFAILAELNRRLDRVRLQLQQCSQTVGKGWQRFAIDSTSTMWRRWQGQTLHLTIQWEAIGSLQQQIASIRAVEFAEPLWDGACWDMWSQHANGASLVRWLEKEPLTGRKREIILERVLCDCLDFERPCWVVLERSPDVADLQNLSGQWGGFNIGPVPKGFTRVASDGGRMIEPIDASRCRCTISVSADVPKVISWLVTDNAMKMVAQFLMKSMTNSWNRIIEGWDGTGYGKHMRENPELYDTVARRTTACLAKSEGSISGG